MEAQLKTLVSTHKILKTCIKKAIFSITNKDEINPIINTVFNNVNQDYSCPSAVRIFNEFKQNGEAFGLKSPKEFAQKLISEINFNEIGFENPKLNEAGFLTFKLKDSFMEEAINNIIRNGVKYNAEEKQKIAVDFSSPNIAKEMHVGHLRSTIIGESLCRFLEFVGHDVCRINHVGDWGTQFGMLISYLKEVYPDYKEKMPDLKDLETFYKASKKKFDEDPDFKKTLNVVKLQSGDPDCLNAWKTICDLSRNEFQKIYKRLSIVVEEYGESFYNSIIPDLIKECEEKKMVTVDKGAKCIFFENEQIPFMIQKSDGGFNYDSTDLAAVKYRLENLKANRIIYITDVGQAPHFQLLFKAAQMAGWHKPPNTRLDHMGFGVVLGEDGKKFKTRGGKTVKLLSLLDDAAIKAKDDLKKRAQDPKAGAITNLKEEEFAEAAEKIGIAAVKYFDLKQNRISDYKFDYNKMLDFKGNTAVYLIYSFVRINSIIKKSEFSEKEMDEMISNGFKFTHDHEKIIASTLLKFPETIDNVIEELEITRLCDLLYLISVKVAEGYNKYRILNEPETKKRLLLCLAVKQIMEICFHLLGIQPLEKI